MPYIKDYLRSAIDDGDPPQTAGELNYAITRLLICFTAGGDYERMNEAIGAIEAAKLEFVRRVVAPYEDRKITENGDVYPCWE